jgi:hypothetical protein
MSSPGVAASQPQGSDSGNSSSGVSAAPAGGPAATGNAPTSSAGNVQTFGGGAIIGVESLITKQSIKEIGGKNHYNEWEFVYDPRVEVLAQAGAAGQVQVQQQQIGQPAGNPANPSPQTPQTPQ